VSRFKFPIRVYYEDTDGGGVVYHARYLNFMERARTELLREKGFEQDELKKNDGIIFVVRSIQLEYLKPARFNDSLTVTADIVETGRASMVFSQSILRDNEELCTGRVHIVCLDAGSFKPVAVPERILNMIDKEYTSVD
jgi:acyl-CoA thioester hydrolase